ncbi:MAG: multiheme c-type cytochrome [Campylobacterota bacterium]|nr:multiheme c-type cytochrome [Campylobacterota bacterium]
MHKKIFFVLTLLSTLFAEPQATYQATYIGDKACAECHSKETREWRGSHHDLAMMVADEKSVKGDFNNTKFNYNGIITTFFRDGDKFMVNTDSEDGSMRDYEISYTFGVYPLQQYMIKFPKGNIQVMDIAWDSRTKEDGGERWYHIHADDNVTAGDILHWTGQNFNWNYMCADCHSTNLKKNYDAEKRSYHTTWDIIDVSCEACHGPASKHIEWSKTPHKELKFKGFALSFKNKKWRWDINTKEKKIGADHQEIEVCAKCHSRRSQLDDDFTPGDKFADHYLAVQLEQNLYFPDGKIEDEVYVYDSFLQSKMYAAGVTCTDCHNPHTLKRKSEGDKVCYQCHSEEKYTATSHHKHKEGGEGASCVGCHMPARTYMGVDSRNDHSFRLPRPDLSAEMRELPNACNLCHTDRDPQWATDAMKKWYGEIPIGKQNFAHSLQALRSNTKDAPKSLYSILMSDAPDIAKATATAYLGSYPSKQTYTTTLQMLRRSDPQIRRSALLALESFPMKMRLKKTFEMLSDPIKIVRIEAARQLASLSLGEVDQKTKDMLEKAFAEYEKTLLFTAERPESQLSLGLFYTNRKMFERAEKAYREAMRLQPQFVPAYINYSNFLTNQGRDKEAFDILQKGVAALPNIAILHHAIGLWYVRDKKSHRAVEELKKALQLDRDSARFAYVYAIAIGESDPKEAIEILEEAYMKHTGDIQIISGLAYYHKERGDENRSRLYERKLKELQNFSVR